MRKKAKTSRAGRNLCNICWPQAGIAGKIWDTLAEALRDRDLFMGHPSFTTRFCCNRVKSVWYVYCMMWMQHEIRPLAFWRPESLPPCFECDDYGHPAKCRVPLPTTGSRKSSVCVLEGLCCGSVAEASPPLEGFPQCMTWDYDRHLCIYFLM